MDLRAIEPPAPDLIVDVPLEQPVAPDFAVIRAEQQFWQGTVQAAYRNKIEGHQVFGQEMATFIQKVLNGRSMVRQSFEQGNPNAAAVRGVLELGAVLLAFSKMVRIFAMEGRRNTDNSSLYYDLNEGELPASGVHVRLDDADFLKATQIEPPEYTQPGWYDAGPIVMRASYPANPTLIALQQYPLSYGRELSVMDSFTLVPRIKRQIWLGQGNS